MLLFDGAFGVIFFVLWLFCIIDVITTPADQVRNLPKLLWLVLVVLLVDIGSIAWLIAGRAWSRTPATVGAGGRRVPVRSSSPDDDDEFLAGLRARADEQRRRAGEAGSDDPPAGPATA